MHVLSHKFTRASKVAIRYFWTWGVLLQACCDNLAQLQGRAVACSLLATEVFNLLYDVTQCITRINPDTQESYPDSLVSEWNEFYTVSAFNQTISLFVKVAGKKF